MPPHDPSCRHDDLVAGIRAGEGLEQLAWCYGDHLVQIARRACRTPEEAEDGVQDAWDEAARHLDAFRDEGSLEGWLTRIVVRACGRLRRGRKNDPALHDPDAVLTADTPDPEEEAARRQLAETLGEALAALSAEDRALVLSSDAEGYTAPELAARYGISAASVRQRLSRARGRIRRAVGDPRLPPDVVPAQDAAGDRTDHEAVLNERP